MPQNGFSIRYLPLAGDITPGALTSAE